MENLGIHYEPEGSLKDVIRHLYVIRNTSGSEPADQHLSPSMEMMLVFNFGKPVQMSFGNELIGSAEIERVAVLGPLRKLLNYRIAPGSELIACVFHSDGFYRLFQVPMHNMAGEQITDPDLLVGSDEFSMLWQNLNSLTSSKDRVEMISQYLLANIQITDEFAAPLLHSISYFNDPLTQPVKALAAATSASERTIQSRFKKYIGISPKEILRFIRFKQVIERIQREQTGQVDWLGIVAEFGYYDQSHLIKDFQHYLETTPQKFITEVAGKEFCVTKPGKYYD